MGKILKIEQIATPPTVFDPACTSPHTYISNGFVSHNCVLLVDEVEKLFAKQDDSGVTSRLLSHLLWWLQSHSSRVFTVMTTNDIHALPSELYRSGRVDKAFTIPLLQHKEVVVLASAVLDSFSTLPNIKKVKPVLYDLMSHAAVVQGVYDAIKDLNNTHHEDLVLE